MPIPTRFGPHPRGPKSGQGKLADLDALRDSPVAQGTALIGGASHGWKTDSFTVSLEPDDAGWRAFYLPLESIGASVWGKAQAEPSSISTQFFL